MAGPLGTLIVVVLKARNLPNKQRIGKQDPYATCTYLSHRKRTKTDKRGGQHPVWDDELRFDIYDNPKDAMASASVSTTATGGVVPVKSNVPSVGSGGATSLKELRVAVYADDPRDPDLIGEGKVDLTETLKKGEFDDWVTVTNKGKYQGEVYLEMTFYSAKPPPDKFQTPTGPIRAGVFEASSPGSGKLPTPTAASNSLNKKPSPSPLSTPSKPINPVSVPAVLRVGRPMSGPTSSGHLPFPGEPSTSKDPSLNSRQRSTGSLSMPTPDFSLEDRPPSRAPSRNHSLDQSKHLVDSMNSLSLSGRASANNHAYLSQPQTSQSPGFQNPSSHQRPYRHSFSGHPHVQSDNSIQQSHSVSPPSHTVESTEDQNHQHSTPQFMDQPHPGFLPSSQSQPGIRPYLPPRRPLPIPGGESVHRPASAWGSSQNISAGGQRYVDSVHRQSPTTYGQYSNNYEHPTVPVMSNNGPTYPPHMQYADSPNPPNVLHQQPTTNQPQQVPYSAQQSQYYPKPPPQNPPGAQPQLSGHVPYNLPPPPAGQAPVPIHEVFANSNSRPFTSGNPSGYLPSASFPPQQSHVQSTSRPNTGGKAAYNYQGSHSDHFQHQNQPFNLASENPPPNHNLYQVQKAPQPPPPPSHVQQQPLKYQTMPIQQSNSSIQGAVPASSTQMYYHPPNYAPPPPRTPDPNFNSPISPHYPEYNNPFHVPQRADSVIPGHVYTRPSLSSNSLPQAIPNPPPPPASPFLPPLNHAQSLSSVPFYYPPTYNQPTHAYPQT